MARKPHTYHYIYKTICTITNKFYIGMHSTANLNDGYIGSGKRLRYSILKYGYDNHTREILEFLPDRISLKAREAEIVNENLLSDPFCMNLAKGGGGDVYLKKWKVKHRLPLSESHKENLSKAMKGIAGKYERTPEIREKIANTLKDQKQSEETRNKRSESHKKYWQENPEAKEKKKESTLKGWATRRQRQETIKKEIDEAL